MFRSWGLAAVLGAVSGAFVLLTFNQSGNGIPYLPLCLGLVHLGWQRWRQGPAEGLPLAGLASGVLGLLLWIQCLAAAWWMHHAVVRPRAVHDFPAGTAPAGSWPEGVAGLRYLLWEEPYAGASRQPDVLLDWLEEHPGRFFVWGDLTLLYALADQPSVGPTLWWHPGLTMPVPGSAAGQAYDQRLQRSLADADLRWVVFDHPEGQLYKGLRLQDLPATAAYLQARTVEEVEVGNYRLWKLRP